MKNYSVELKYTAYMIIEVEAANEEEAQQKAWEDLDKNGGLSRGGAWELESIEEFEGGTK